MHPPANDACHSAACSERHLIYVRGHRNFFLVPGLWFLAQLQCVVTTQLAVVKNCLHCYESRITGKPFSPYVHLCRESAKRDSVVGTRAPAYLPGVSHEEFKTNWERNKKR